MAEARKSVLTIESHKSEVKVLICSSCQRSSIPAPAGAGPSTKFTCKNCLRTNWAPIPEMLKVRPVHHPFISTQQQRWWDRKCAEDRQSAAVPGDAWRLAANINGNPSTHDILAAIAWPSGYRCQAEAHKEPWTAAVTLENIVRLTKLPRRAILLAILLDVKAGAAAKAMGLGPARFNRLLKIAKRDLEQMLTGTYENPYTKNLHQKLLHGQGGGMTIAAE